MNGLSLCAGIGGLDLALHKAIDGYTTICYVEKERFPRQVLIRRMVDGFLAPAPIHGDVKTFNAKLWHGLVDIVHGGYPCQPFSSAARGRYSAENLWPEFRRIICDVEPTLVFVENVGGSKRQQERAAGDLRDVGYQVAGPFSCAAADVGAPHIRRRLFVLGYSDKYTQCSCGEYAKTSGVSDNRTSPWERRLSQHDNGRMVDGISPRMDQLKALGNGVVPAQGALAFVTLLRELLQ